MKILHVGLVIVLLVLLGIASFEGFVIVKLSEQKAVMLERYDNLQDSYWELVENSTVIRHKTDEGTENMTIKWDKAGLNKSHLIRLWGKR